MDTRALKLSGQLGNEFLPKSKYTMFFECCGDTAKNSLYGRTYPCYSMFSLLLSLTCFPAAVLLCIAILMPEWQQWENLITLRQFFPTAGEVIMCSLAFSSKILCLQCCRHQLQLVYILKECEVLLKDSFTSLSQMDRTEKISQPKLMGNFGRVTMEQFSQSSTPWRDKTVCVTLNQVHCDVLLESCKHP